MAWQNVYPSGLGQSLGDSYVTAEPFYTTGVVWYVYATTGVDAADPNGRSPAKPFATLTYAIAAASTYDTIVLMDGHIETLTAAATPKTGQVIVGGGTSSGKPTVKLTMNAAAAGMLTVSAACVQLRNIWFKANSQANSAVLIAVTGAGVLMKDCYVECAQYDDNYAVSLGAGSAHARIEGTTFISTATVLTAQPYTALGIITTLATGQTLSGVTFDGGTVGFSTGYAANIAVGATALRLENLTLLRGADVLVLDSASPTVSVSGITSDSSASIRTA